MRRFFIRFTNLFRRRSAEYELSREIEAHLGLLQEDFESRGLSPDEAKLAARRAYGGVEQAREMQRDARSFPWLENRFQDLRYGCRSLLRTPGFTAISVLTLGLGIGANTAIFSVVNAVLLQPLDYKDAGRLITILHRGVGPVAVANYMDWRDASRSFEAMAAAEYWSPNITGSEAPEHLVGLRVTRNLLPMLGVNPLLGRLFAAGEEGKGNEHKVILSYRLWERRFGRNIDAIGDRITLDGAAYTVIGVMPAGFKFAPFWATGAELWTSEAFEDRIHDRGSNSLRVFARLKQGTTLAQARAEIAAITGRLEKQFPATNRSVAVTPLKENVVGKIETPLLILLCSVGFVLLIACANVTHMLLARTSERQREIAVRIALGAARSRVIGQFLTENLLLGLLGCVAALLFAFAGIKALAVLGPAYLPRVETVSIDGPVILFLIAASSVAVAVFGLAPALHAANANLSDTLKEGGRGDSGGVRSNRLRSFLVQSEFALAFMLLMGAGLLIRSFIALQSVDPGFNPHNVLSLVVSVAGSKEAQPNGRAIFYPQLLQRVRALPGVSSASAINHLPLAGDMWGRSFAIAGRPPARPGESPVAIYRIVMPGYFKTMQLPVRRGREISGSDDARSRAVVVINERAARLYWPGENPIGERIRLTDDKTWLTVIGVAADAKQADWAAAPMPEIYLAALQTREYLNDVGAHMAYITMVLRSAGDPADLVAAVKKRVWSLDPNLPVSEVSTMDRVVANANAQPRFEMFLFELFAAVALVLATVGIYGVVNYSVSRRKREIGIRMSLGATRADVLRMVLRQGMTQAITGMAAGIAGVLLLSRLLAGMLYSVRPNDPVTFAGVAAVLGVAALLASYVPAQRASRVEPITALRSE